ncbi:MAG: STAS domain-containing protein [Roseiflexaceae bacterium]|nr:STAS domain-containing protein [Roseiflexaceae bacterium]
MVAYLLLPILMFLVALATLVLAQNSDGRLNRLLAGFLVAGLVSVVSGIVRLTAPDATWASGAYIGTILGLAWSSVLLTWLIMALFIPQRFDQPLVRRLISAPYLLAIALLAIDSLLGLGWFYGGVAPDIGGGYRLLGGRYSLILIFLFMIGRIVPIVIAAVVAVREPRWRRLGSGLVLAMIASLVISSLNGSNGQLSELARLLIYVGQLPVFLVLAWATQRSESFRPSNQVLQAAINSLPDGLLVLDDAARVRYANSAALRLLHASNGQQPLLADLIAAAGFHSTQVQGESDGRRGRLTSGPTTLEITEATVSGDPVARQLMLLRDITLVERQSAALADSRDQLRVRAADLEASLREVQQRDEVINNLSLPLIPITQEITVLPLIGTFDALRSPKLVERLLCHVETSRVRMVLVDMTGVSAFDVSLARALRQVVGGVRLMGARVALCGVRPELAETIIHENFNWHEISLFATLQEGVQAMQLMARAAPPLSPTEQLSAPHP